MKKATFVLSLITILALLVPAAGAQSTFAKTVAPIAPAVGDTVTVSFQVSVDSASIPNTFTIDDPIPANMTVVTPLPAGFTTDGTSVTWTGMVDAQSGSSFVVSYQLLVASYVPTEVNSTATLTVENFGQVATDDAPFYIAWEQTQNVDGGAPVVFNAGNSPSVTILSPAGQNLGDVTASYVNNFLLTTTGLQNQGIGLYFQITDNNAGDFAQPVQVMFTFPVDALQGNTCDANMRVYSNPGTGNVWTELVPSAAAVVGTDCQVTVSVNSFSYFVLSSVAAPTAITLETFAASGSAPLALLAVAVVALTVLGLALRRRSA